MGNYFTINMEENFKKNQDFITEMNKVKVCDLFDLLINREFSNKAFIVDRKTSTFAKSNAGTCCCNGNRQRKRIILLVWCILYNECHGLCDKVFKFLILEYILLITIDFTDIDIEKILGDWLL